MARIRSIKPEFWTSEQVMECSPMARLLFIGLWNFADDHGRLPYSPKTIKAQIFPADQIDVDSIRRMFDELSSNGLVSFYSVDGKEYFLITGWHHQKIDKRQPAKHPPPPEEVVEHSTNGRRMVSTDLKGSEGIGKETAVAQSAPPSQFPISLDPPRCADHEAEYFRRVREILGKSAGGIAAKVLKAKGGSIPLARAAIEQASTKSDPREYLGAIIRGREGSDDLRARGDAW